MGDLAVTPEQTALVSQMELRITDRFEQLTVPQPQEAARRLVEELLHAGWRPWPGLADKAPPRQAAPSWVARQALAEARAVVERKRRERQAREGAQP